MKTGEKPSKHSKSRKKHRKFLISEKPLVNFKSHYKMRENIECSCIIITKRLFSQLRLHKKQQQQDKVIQTTKLYKQ